MFSEDSPDYEQRIRVDYIVTTWILNYISKDVVESFLYIMSDRDLCQETSIV